MTAIFGAYMPEHQASQYRRHQVGSIGATALKAPEIHSGGGDAASSIPAGWFNTRLMSYISLSVLLLLLLTELHQHPAAVNVDWFIVLKTTKLTLAIVISLLGLTYYHCFNARSLLFVSIGFIGSSLIEWTHVISIAGVESLTAASLYNQNGWSSATAHLYLAIMLLVGWRASEGQISTSTGKEYRTGWVILLSGLLLLVLVIGSIFISDSYTADFRNNHLRLADSLVGMLYLATLAVHLYRGDWRKYRFQHLFVLALILAFLGQSVYMPLLVQSGDTTHLAGRLLGVASYSFVLLALISSTSNLFKQAGTALLEERINSAIGQSRIASGEAAANPDANQVRNASGTFELNLLTNQFKGNRVTIGLLGGIGEALAVRNLEQFVEKVHPDDHARVVAGFRRCQVDGELFRQDFRVATPDGFRWLQAVGGIEYCNNKAVKLLGFIDDTTEQKAIELEKDRLYRELDQIATALDHFAISATFELDGTVSSANRAFGDFCLTNEEDLIGKKFDALITEDLSEAAKGAIWQALRAGNTWSGMVTLAGKHAVERVAFASFSVHLNDDLEADTFTLLGMDTTARVSARRALQESIESHKKSNADLQMFAHIVSHDLQEPLRMVTSFMSLLERRYAADLDQDAREFIQFAVEGATRMRSLLDGLLDYSRIQTKSLDFGPVALGEPIADAIANLELLIKESGAVIKYSNLPEIHADRAQIMQLFQNLIANGIKFCRDKTPKIEISAHRDDGRWVVQVSDNGIGIDPAHYQKIFQMFQRLHTREEYSGTGVGLTICSRIMERHGGSIDVESLEGQGSTFFLNF